MLILERYPGEEISIFTPGQEEPIVIRLVKVTASRAKIGVSAPGAVEVLRNELVTDGAMVGPERPSGKVAAESSGRSR